MSFSKFARVWAIGAVCVAIVAGCSAGGDETSADTDGNVPVATEVKTEALTVELENQVAHASKFGMSHILVELVSKSGTPQFSVEIHRGQENEDTIMWKRLEAANSDHPTQGTLQVAYADLPSLEDSVNVAEFVQGNVNKAVAGNEFDNWGCDLPRWVRGVASCGPKGICCDIHDACYARHRCTQSSWLRPWGACGACNAAVVACMSNPSLPPIGPSVCCFRGNCGRPR